MKKLLIMILAGVMVCSLAACGGNEVQENNQLESALNGGQTSEPAETVLPWLPKLVGAICRWRYTVF